MPNIPTQSNLIEFTREDSHTDNTAIQANEGDVKGESALGFELAYVPVRTIASWIPCSTQILNDAPALQNYVNTRLMYFNSLKIKNEILNGSGTGTEILGLRAQATAYDTTRTNTAPFEEFERLVQEGKQAELAKDVAAIQFFEKHGFSPPGYEITR